MNHKIENTGIASFIFGIVLLGLSGVSHAGSGPCHGTSGSDTDDGIDWYAVMYLDQ